MKIKITDEQLIDYLSQEASTDTVASIETAITQGGDLPMRLEALRQLQSEVMAAADEKISNLAENRFADFLAAEMDKEKPVRQLRAKPRKRWLAIAAAAASILLVFSLGRELGRQETGDTGRELAATRSLMLELMQAEKTSDRIEATTVALSAKTADPELIENLGYLLHNDKNTNVQLAALSALRRFGEEQSVRDLMLKAIGEPDDRPEIVRLQLIEVLVGLREERVLPYLEELINNQSLPQHLKDAAQMGKFKLI